MIKTKTYPPSRFSRSSILFFRFFIQRFLPASWFRSPLPTLAERHKKTENLTLEIVSHCWQYSNMLTYQLSSFVNNPPKDISLTVTVFYSKDDAGTVATLAYFSTLAPENITWNWQPLTNGKLFRRGIGRNMAALSTKADWVWYTDCDIIFHKNCLDSLAEQLKGKTESLYFPRQEYTTEMLAESDPMLQANSQPQVVDINSDNFSLFSREKAKGAFQIVHGDVARAIGYCGKLFMFQTESERWRKTYEDTAFKWLIKSEGIPLEVEGVFQIRHIKKGRYTEDSWISKLRSKIRRTQE
ncbi:MAG: glycosyltransferase family 2 protein [Colwellia sp.]|nr:glycosyltransferase family 2 protein [Colwellia sp.]